MFGKKIKFSVVSKIFSKVDLNVDNGNVVN